MKKLILLLLLGLPTISFSQTQTITFAGSDTLLSNRFDLTGATQAQVIMSFDSLNDGNPANLNGAWPKLQVEWAFIDNFNTAISIQGQSTTWYLLEDSGLVETPRIFALNADTTIVFGLIQFRAGMPGDSASTVVINVNLNVKSNKQ